MDTNKIFARLSKVLGVKTDSALAESLGLSRQAIANSRNRETVPYEKIVELAEKEDLSLDYLFLGKGTDRNHGGEIQPQLLSAIETAFSKFDEIDLEVMETGTAYDQALVYNRIIKQNFPEFKWYNLIEDEVKHLFEIRKINYDRYMEDSNLFSDKHIMHEEELRELNILQNEVNKMNKRMAKQKARLIGEKKASISQSVKGDNNQVAGGDISNNDK